MFSVGQREHWCFDVLAELGFTYDSSILPTGLGRPEAPLAPFVFDTRNGPLVEFPIATFSVGRLRLPLAGGGYLRIVPSCFLERTLRQFSGLATPAIVYCHPYEFQDGWLHVGGLGIRDLLRPAYLRLLALHNFRTDHVEALLTTALGGHRFATLGELHAERFVAPPADLCLERLASVGARSRSGARRPNLSRQPECQDGGVWR